ncbi:MAG: hypothetical protein U9Q66_04340 [Patescibacteria group bacterium]|nr:hypothetical protein [Patescibacteria group bacterium]
MKKTLLLYKKENIELPYILDIFNNEVDSIISDHEYLDLENKISKVYSEDLIPIEIKNKIKF